MGFITKLWKDRQSEFPNRRTLTKEDQSTELVTVTRSEGVISEEGDAFSAENMNDLETRIKNAIGTGSIPEDLGADIIAAINALNTNLSGKQNTLTLYTYGLNFDIASKAAKTGIITRANFGMPSSAIPLFCDVGQQYDIGTIESVAQDIDVAYSLQQSGNNTMPYKVYNNHTGTHTVHLTFRVLAYIP